MCGSESWLSIIAQLYWLYFKKNLYKHKLSGGRNWIRVNTTRICNSDWRCPLRGCTEFLLFPGTQISGPSGLLTLPGEIAGKGSAHCHFFGRDSNPRLGLLNRAADPCGVVPDPASYPNLKKNLIRIRPYRKTGSGSDLIKFTLHWKQLQIIDI